ncbi:MAG: NAD(+)/NADH kinase [Lachnospiraceae bacterium]|nr:NAD(+)/NADH kinase [Lachnospiraceae bacterium]
MNILVVTKNNISKGKVTVKSLKSLLDKKKINHQIITFDEVENFYDEIHNKNYKNNFDMLLSFGGDGTILKSARIARKLDIPILGVNAGTIGFLTSVNNFEDLETAIDKIKKNDYLFEERSMIEVRVIRDEEEVFKAYAVNEATFMTSSLSKMGKYKMFIGEEKSLFTELNADGVIVATPTGSTAHSLSAGGPIVSPSVNCLIITPLYPHTLNQRSFVINDNKELCISIMANKQEVDIDGRVNFELQKDDEVVIKRLKKTIKYIVFKSNNFLNTIKDKIKAL